MVLIDPLTAVVVSLVFLVVLLYKRVNLGITLNAAALLLAFLALDWETIPDTVYTTSVDPLTISIVLATFGVMLLSQLYKETKVITVLSDSLSRLVKNPKIVISVLPAIIGFLPVAGGALMSAPLVDSEAEKLALEPKKKAYVNLWFRHTIFPVYPLSQVLIITAALTGLTVSSIILRQIPVVLVMIVVGYVIGFWKVKQVKNQSTTLQAGGSRSDLKVFLVAFSPILVTIAVAVGLDLLGYELAKVGFDVLIATMVGLVVLIIVSKPSFKTYKLLLANPSIYGVTLAAYGAFLLRSTMVRVGISQFFSPLVTNGNVDVIILLTVIPAVLGVLTGSPSGGVTIGISILSGILVFSPRVASLIYMSAYLGYTVAPTHLCFTLTADHFKCTLGKIYRYLIPSFIITFATTLAVYFLL